jgi:hypothetical protein
MMVVGEPDAKLSRSPVPRRLFNVDDLACRTSSETNATDIVKTNFSDDTPTLYIINRCNNNFDDVTYNAR